MEEITENETMICAIKEYCHNYDKSFDQYFKDYYYDLIKNCDIPKIYNLLIHDIFTPITPVQGIDNNTTSIGTMIYYGIYHEVNKNYEEMEKYYLMVINSSGISSNEGVSVIAMYLLGDYYRSIKEYELMEKYYLMAIEFLGIEEAGVNVLCVLGDYYCEKKDYKLMKTYYLTAIKNHNTIYAKNKLVKYCMCNNDYNELFTHIIEFNNYDILNLRISLRDKFFEHKFTSDELKMISNKTPEELKNSPQIIKFTNKLLNTNIDIIKLHFEYSMEGKGFQEAKADFFNNLSEIEE